MDSLQELLARDAIRQLAARYALAVDGKDLDGIATLFVDDVENGRYGTGSEGVKRFETAYRPELDGGEVVFLCWQFGESRVIAWHNVDSGFSERQPLPGAPNRYLN